MWEEVAWGMVSGMAGNVDGMYVERGGDEGGREGKGGGGG